MQLQLFVKGELIASMPINTAYVNYPVYLPSLKSQLQEKNKRAIEAAQASPSFYISTSSSAKKRDEGNMPIL